MTKSLKLANGSGRGTCGSSSDQIAHSTQCWRFQAGNRRILLRCHGCGRRTSPRCCRWAMRPSPDTGADSEMARQKRGAAGFFWLSLIVATAMSEDAPSKPSPRRMRSTGRGRNPSADLTNEGSLTAPNEPTTAPLCGRAPRRWYSTASLSQTNDHPLRTRAIMSAMPTFGRRHPVHRRALRQVAHRQPDDHVVSRDAVRHYISRFFRGDQ